MAAYPDISPTDSEGLVEGDRFEITIRPRDEDGGEVVPTDLITTIKNVSDTVPDEYDISDWTAGDDDDGSFYSLAFTVKAGKTIIQVVGEGIAKNTIAYIKAEPLPL